jgi:hypothetical protein
MQSNALRSQLLVHFVFAENIEETLETRGYRLETRRKVESDRLKFFICSEQSAGAMAICQTSMHKPRRNIRECKAMAIIFGIDPDRRPQPIVFVTPASSL